jgi:non-heme chloroperoxidase
MGYRISRMAKDIHDLMGEIGLSNAVLLGWSMGAAVVFSYIDLFGDERLRGIVVVDQSPRQYYSPDWKLGQAACYDAEALAALCTRLEHDVEGVASGTVHGCLTKAPSAEELSFFTREILRCPAPVQAAIMTDHTNLDWRDLVPRISVPAMVLVGRKSRIFPWEGSAWVGEHIPGAQTVFFEESGHMLFYEEHEKFNSVVTDWVKRC